MGDFLSGVTLAQLTPPVIVSLAILMVLTGRLVPRRFYDEKVKEVQEWRAQGKLKDERLAEQSDQINELIEVGKVAKSVLQALPHPREDK